MICPFATYRPVPSHGRSMTAQLGNVLHVQEGNGSPYGEFSNPANKASSHFWISKDGLIEQYIDSDSASWAQAAGNYSYTSTETEGFVTEPLTSAQIASYAKLYVWLASVHGYPMQEANQVGERGLGVHYMGGESWGGHPCPGPIRATQRSQILALAQGHQSSEEEKELPRYVDKWTWPNGDQVQVFPDGHVEAYGGPRFFGTMLDLRPDAKQGFQEARAIGPVNPTDSQSGYIVYSQNNSAYRFQPGVDQFFAKK